MDSNGKNSLRFCLDCSECVRLSVRDNGWWTPSCKHWNRQKSTEEKKYGPDVGCVYMLEHTLMDNRMSFKICCGEIAQILMDYRISINNNKECSMQIHSENIHGGSQQIKYLLISKYDKNGYKISCEELADFINTILKSHIKGIINKRFDRFLYCKEEKRWVYETVNEVKKPHDVIKLKELIHPELFDE